TLLEYTIIHHSTSRFGSWRYGTGNTTFWRVLLDPWSQEPTSISHQLSLWLGSRHVLVFLVPYRTLNSALRSMVGHGLDYSSVQVQVVQQVLHGEVVDAIIGAILQP